MMIFSEKDINDTYLEFVVKPAEYFNKSNIEYDKLSSNEKVKWFNRDFPRLASLFDFKDWIVKYNISTGDKLLSTFIDDCELEYINYNKLYVADYSKDSRFDIHTMVLSETNFDFIIFNQTLEHLYNPFMAMENLYKHLNPGGYLYTTVPTINIPHMQPFHFWGITPIGLCMLCKSVGFNILECGYWGNLEYIKYIFSNNNWPTTDDVLNDNKMIDNNMVCQAQTWVLIQKPKNEVN
jgi:SAM-dependent methyltransferase